MRFDSLDEWLEWQQTCHSREIDLGLERVTEVARQLDLLTPAATIITVAGTNGKGSCVAALEKFLTGAEQTVGSYTSPHLLRYNERIRINGREADDAAICRAFAAIDAARGDISLSYFEFGTLAALWLFRDCQVDYWVLEVGLGGRLDATNILDADIAVLTTVAVDHQQWLGSDRETIGFEKAGIFRSRKPVVCADRNPPDSVLRHAAALECPVFLLGADFDCQLSGEEWKLSLTAASSTRPLILPAPQLPAPSVAAALQVLSLLDRLPPISVLRQVCRELQLPGRYQSLTWAKRPIYLDVAHNPAAAQYLAERLQQSASLNWGAVVAMMADKDLEGCLKPLLPYVSHWWLVDLIDIPRAAKPEVIQQTLERLGVAAAAISVPASIGDSLEQFASEDTFTKNNCEALLITGSFFTVAAALQVLEQKKTLAGDP